jgi:hypothetical protein
MDKISNAAVKPWPTEALSTAEIARRYMMFGIESLKDLSPANQSRDTPTSIQHDSQRHTAEALSKHSFRNEPFRTFPFSHSDLTVTVTMPILAADAHAA